MKTVDIEAIIGEMQFEPMSLQAFAHWRRESGHDVVQKNGIYWQQVYKGFYQPVHFLQKVPIQHIKSPGRLHWGVRGALAGHEQHLANGAIIIYTLEGLETFDLDRLSKKRRQKIRGCFNKVEIREITDKSVLLEQGYDIVKSSLQRTRHKAIPDKEKYLHNCAVYIDPGDSSRIVLGAFVGEKLVGYFEMFAVESTAYQMNMMLAPEALKLDVSAGLAFTAYMLCKRSGGVTDVFAGGHSYKFDKDLDHFKQSMGLVLKKIPFYCRINKFAGKALQMKCPEKYHRLVGDPV